MKRIAIISIISVAIFSSICYSVSTKKTVPMATGSHQEGVCIGGDEEGLACL